jgi:hypothetical protein
MAAPTTVAQYLASVPAEQRAALEAVRKVILANLDADYEEGIQYGAIGYYVPHRVFPAGYHCDPRQPLPFAGLAARKHYCTLSMMTVYGSAAERARFEADWARSGKKLKMGKACIEFKSADDVALDAVGKAVARGTAKQWVALYESLLGGRAPRKRAAKPAPAKKRPAKSKSAKRR